MPICPECKAVSNNRKDGACPACGTPVELYGGSWYRTSDGSPLDYIVKHFATRVAKIEGQKRNTSVSPHWLTPKMRTRWRRELGLAAQLLTMADEDRDLVVETLDLMFQDRGINFKTITSLLALSKEFPLFLAMAIDNREKATQRQAKESNSFDQAMAEYNRLFSSG